MYWFLGCKAISPEPFQGLSSKAFLTVLLTKFFNGELRGVPVEGVAGKRQYGGWNKGKAFPYKDEKTDYSTIDVY